MIISETKREKYKTLRDIFSQAEEFLCAYTILNEHQITRMQRGALPNMVSAPIVQLLFAIELFLKTLLIAEDKKEKGHCPERLFKKLSPQMQEEIKCAFDKHCLKTMGRKHDLFGISFEQYLEQYSNSYMQWRYFHETNQITFYSQFCDKLVLTLRDIAHTCVEKCGPPML